MSGTGGVLSDPRNRALEAITRIDKHSAQLAEATEDRDDAIREMHEPGGLTPPEISRALADGRTDGKGVSISNVRLILRSRPRR